MYARRIAGRRLTFDFAAGLINDNLLVVDRETRSVWSQLAGKAIDGALKDTLLERVPALQTTWKYWRQTHPQTRVSVLEGGGGQPYVYRNSRARSFRRRTHDTSALGLGLVLGGQAWFFPFEQLARMRAPFEFRLGKQILSLHYSPEGLTAWAEDSGGTLQAGVLSYEHGWFAFHPESKRFQADEKAGAGQ